MNYLEYKVKNIYFSFNLFKSVINRNQLVSLSVYFNVNKSQNMIITFFQESVWKKKSL